ncbi:MAG: tRNA (N6-isopentenyl adenosine(37)-C2)-methylthiotransferase MiaB [Bacilli bacterium]|nr:tRNA (N6-isopentenyl adenosine(37)-C2)-methylthiotransferase MiaB [Bacilli bacterium]
MNLPDYKEAKSRKEKTTEIEKYIYNSNYSNIGYGKKYFVKTYGCQMNEHDSENICAMLEEMGYTLVDNYMDADLVILNTCSIRENANNKAFGMLGRLKNLKETKKDLVVGLCGCMAQEEKVVDKIFSKYKWVNFVFGTHNLHRLPIILNEAFLKGKTEVEVFSKEGNIIEDMPVKRTSKYSAYVNIIYGCDKFCTYCIVPLTRGRQRSRTKEDIIKEINSLIKDGYKEITLLGQNVNAYGKDFDYHYDLANLLEDVAKTGIERIKFTTSHPWDFTDLMIDVIAKYDNIMPFIHLPVQSGSSRILKLMGRRYTREDYLTLFDKIKSKVKNVSISTDIIVGFPGEEEEDFLETMSLAEYCKFDHAFTFLFSKREGTAACRLPDITSISGKEDRLYRLNDIVNKYFLENNMKMIDKVCYVLVEGTNKKKGSLFGYNENNKLVNFMGSEDLIGKIVPIKITKAKTWNLDGEIYE